MKILVTADYHIILGKKNVPDDWAIDRYRSLFSQINAIDFDIHVVAGDIFDRSPTLKELNLFYTFISSCVSPTYIIDGNHCATRKNRTFLTLLSDVVSYINPLVSIVTEPQEFEWGTLLPYCYLHRKGVLNSLNPTKPLFTHVRGAIPPHVQPEVDLDLLARFPIVYAGDLHSHTNSQQNIVYPGSPITTSFHRNKVETGYIMTEGTKWEWKPFSVPQLIRKTITDPADMVETKYDHTIYELEGSLTELSSIKNSDLLDKKLVQRNSDTSLKLTKEMSIEQELIEFLVNILELSEERVKEVVGVFRDNI